MLKGRLGLETARVPHADRHGLVWLGRGRLFVESGTLRFAAAGDPCLERGEYAVPFQAVSAVLLGPGTTVSHDALRLLARHGTGLLAVGEDGVRFYASMPFGADNSRLARTQATWWGDKQHRIAIARRMYAWRIGEIFPHADITVLRGIEGSRVKEMYRTTALQFGIKWEGRRYDRKAPEAADPPNQAINHAASAVEGAAMIAVAVVSALPQLGFIHEDSGAAFCLDIADLFRDAVTVPCAFAAVREWQQDTRQPIERVVRRYMGRELRRKKVIPEMITKIKELFGGDDRRGDA